MYVYMFDHVCIFSSHFGTRLEELTAAGYGARRRRGAGADVAGSTEWLSGCLRAYVPSSALQGMGLTRSRFAFSSSDNSDSID